MEHFVTNGDFDDFAPQGGESEKAAMSPLAALHARRAEIVSELYLDIKVPRWDNPEIYVRFRPASAIKLSNSLDKRRKTNQSDWAILANADMLIDACIGVYAVLDGEHDEKFSLRKNDPNGSWTTFDADLAEALGVTERKATAVVQALFLTEGDLIDTANKLFAWSGIAGDEADATF